MTPFTDRAIVLRRQRSGETSLALELLCRTTGRTHVLAKGVLVTSLASAAALDLLQEADVVLKRHRPGGRSWVQEAVLIEAFAGLRRDFKRFELACYFAGLIALCLDSEHPAPEIYDLLRLALGHLDTHDASLKAMLRFELRLLELLGLSPVGGALSPPRFATIFGHNFHALPPSRPRLLDQLAKG